MNVNPSGAFWRCDTKDALFHERNLNESLRRIKSDLLKDEGHLDCPHSKNAYLMYTGPRSLERNLELYKKYSVLCLYIFYGYKLGHPIPKLDVFQKLVETKVELMKTKDDVASRESS